MKTANSLPAVVAVTFVALGASVPTFACGGPAATSGGPASPIASTSSTAPAPSGSDSAGTATAAEPEEDLDPNESPTPIAMTVSMPTKPAFPKATVTEAECWKEIELTGKHAKDYTLMAEHCGAPAGLVEYAKPVVGRIHHTKDKRDTFYLKLKGGFCYRYFATADDSIKDLDILVETKDGALVADDKTKSPVAIIEMSKSWCQSSDVEYQFQIEVDGPGKGGYTFGVWARPQ